VQKIMWFLYPPMGDTEIDWVEWTALATRWRPPAGVTRWLRSRGRGRDNSFLDPTAKGEGRDVALEEFWVEAASVDALRAALADREGGLAAYLSGLCDLDASHMVTTGEIEVIAGPRIAGQGRTGMALLVPQAGVSRAQCVEHWTTRHAAIVIRQADMTHYNQCPVVDHDAIYAGVPVIHFGSEALADAFNANAAHLEEQAQDARQFVNLEENIRFNFNCEIGQHEVQL